jgi:hypothetical protein
MWVCAGERNAPKLLVGRCSSPALQLGGFLQQPSPHLWPSQMYLLRSSLFLPAQAASSTSTISPVATAQPNISSQTPVEKGRRKLQKEVVSEMWSMICRPLEKVG